MLIQNTKATATITAPGMTSSPTSELAPIPRNNANCGSIAACRPRPPRGEWRGGQRREAGSRPRARAMVGARSTRARRTRQPMAAIRSSVKLREIDATPIDSRVGNRTTTHERPAACEVS
jgi:hypothetical protein